MTTKRRILLIDDDAAVTSYLMVKLAKLFEVSSINDPRQAVAMARIDRPDAILCDIDMPHMSGGDVTAALAADPQTARIPVIYLTSLVSPQEAEDLQGQVGGRPGVSKRAPLAELVEAIDKVTGAGAG